MYHLVKFTVSSAKVGRTCVSKLSKTPKVECSYLAHFSMMYHSNQTPLREDGVGQSAHGKLYSKIQSYNWRVTKEKKRRRTGIEQGKGSNTHKRNIIS